MPRDLNASLVDYLTKQKHLFERQIRKAHENTTKRNIHELRVTIRRIRAALWLIGHGSPRISLGKVPSSLRKLGQVLGKRRELDVAMEDANHYHLKTNKLKYQRRSTRRKLFSKIDSKHRKKIQHGLEKAIMKLQKYPELDLTPGLVRIRSKLVPWVGKSRINNDELHELRITAKKARYVLEALGRPIELLRNLQGPLGRGHDLEVLQVLSGKNSKIQSDALLQFQKARQIIQPTLHFAIEQLGSRN